MARDGTVFVMAPGDELSTRERLLDVAMTLFASKGYTATSVADIQHASGIAADSDVFYQHFASKRELVDAAVRRYLDKMTEARDRFDAQPPRDAEQMLHQTATLVWGGITDHAPVLRVVLRDPESFPGLADELWKGIIANVYQRFADGLSAAVAAGYLAIADPEATAALLVASLAYYPIMRLLIGHTPGDLDEDRYREAWVQHALAVITAPPRPASQ